MLILLGLILLAIPLALPIATLVSQILLRRRMRDLEEQLGHQRQVVEELRGQVSRLKKDMAAPAAEAPRPEPATQPVVPPTPIPTKPVTPPASARPADSAPPPARPAVPKPSPPPAPTSRPPVVTTPPVLQRLFAGFDWENLIGVRLFSVIAGVALVLAAIFFLRYSLEHGWLSPPVRMAIGILVSTTLLVLCERKAARRYPITANAMDAAAIAILFATFFAGHALWNLIPTALTFGLLVLVTVLAVLLSIRRDSIFIALLGLLGGFATPALLSTGENRPIPLFTYLLLLNLGLASVAYKKKWPVLTLLTLVFTTLYQWGWVLTFLSVSQLPLAMGIFLVFAVTSFAALALGRTAAAERTTVLALDRTSVAAAAMPLVFVIFLAAVPRYGTETGLLFGFLLLLDAGLLGVSLGRRDERMHVVGAAATLLTMAIWLATSYSSAGWRVAVAFTVAFGSFYALAPVVADRFGRRFEDVGRRAVYTAPLVLFLFPVVAAIEPATAPPALLFGALFGLALLIAWRARVTRESELFFIAAFFVVAAEASWSALRFQMDHLGAAIVLYAAFAAFYLGVPFAWRRAGLTLRPAWGSSVVLLASVAPIVYFTPYASSAARVWGLAVLVTILTAELFIESAWRRLDSLWAAGAAVSLAVLSAFWSYAAGSAGVLPSLLVLTTLSLAMGGLYAWADALRAVHQPTTVGEREVHPAIYVGLLGHLFLCFFAGQWATPPWPLFGAMIVMTLVTSAVSLAIASGELHAAGVGVAAAIVLVFAATAPSAWSPVALAAGEIVAAYALASLFVVRRQRLATPAAVGAASALFIAELTAIVLSTSDEAPALYLLAAAHVLNLSLILFLAWRQRWPYVAPAAVVPAWLATLVWQEFHRQADQWQGALALALVLYAEFVAYPFVLGRRARDTRDPYFTAIAGSVFFFFAARAAFTQGDVPGVGIVPVAEGFVLALLLRNLLRMQPAGSRDLGRLALVAGAALGFATVAIPLQLRQQWVTIGWALEGAALAWLYLRVPHRGLLYAAVALQSVVFARLALNPAIFEYEPRGMRIFNWYLYAYLTCAAAFLLSAWWLSRTDDRIEPRMPRASALLPSGAAILLFLLLNIEIADFYAAGPEITFRFGATLAQDLTYTIGWLAFGLGLLVAGIYVRSRAARSAAVALIGLTACKAFLYDMGSLGGLHRVASLVGLAVSLSLVAIALQKFVLRTKEAS